MEIQPKNKGQLDYYTNLSGNSFLDNIGFHLIDFIQTLVVCGAIFVIIYLFVAQPHRVSGRSMLPTFEDGDFILTDKISYRIGEPKRGDVIVLKYPKSENQEFIKRVIGLPGDTIQIQDSSLYINGKHLEENYLAPGTPTHGADYINEGATIQVKENQYFVFGDNRTNSSDSRNWGPITKQEIVGKTFFRYWPLKNFGFTNLK